MLHFLKTVGKSPSVNQQLPTSVNCNNMRANHEWANKEVICSLPSKYKAEIVE